MEPQDSGPHMSKAVEGSDDGSQEPLEDNAGSIGLNVIYTPENGHKADIVFVHGLGGTSRHTWSKHKSTKLFWPLTFLPLEPDLCLARIFTFGYNANFRKAGNISASILDFAKELLFDLKYGQDADKNDLGMGNVSSDALLKQTSHANEEFQGAPNFRSPQYGWTHCQRGK